MSEFLKNILLCGAASFTATIVTLYFLIPYLAKKAFLDVPNSRSSHTKVTPRGGGLGVIAGILTGSAVSYLLKLPLPHVTFYIGLIIIAVTSFADDRKSLPVFVRLTAHITAMGLVIWYTGGLKIFPFPPPFNIDLGLAGYLVSAVWIISVINFFNFLDGIDGLAGSQAMLAGIALCTAVWGDLLTVAGTCIALAALGFLIYNWHPAKVFMGDVGSVTLGFTFATLPFYSDSFKIEEGVYSTAVFIWFFLADGAFTLVRRLLNKEKIWEAHRSHLYQRLNKTGWPHDRVVTYIMLLSVLLVCIQLYFIKSQTALNWVSFAAGILLFIIYFFTVFYFERKKSG